MGEFGWRICGDTQGTGGIAVEGYNHDTGHAGYFHMDYPDTLSAIGHEDFGNAAVYGATDVESPTVASGYFGPAGAFVVDNNSNASPEIYALSSTSGGNGVWADAVGTTVTGKSGPGVRVLGLATGGGDAADGTTEVGSGPSAAFSLGKGRRQSMRLRRRLGRIGLHQQHAKDREIAALKTKTRARQGMPVWPPRSKAASPVGLRRPLRRRRMSQFPARGAFIGGILEQTGNPLSRE
jgi:hypothetical protein